ncbi:hypothetical protein ACFC3F_09890 [Microbacterium sp. NPDC055910]|uniref:hypothetical protein n=1 Tax=Microbacterium sp. NPDC055910 TaxID=3345659 RepID=UPI0035D949B6
MSTPEQPNTPPLTRKQLREMRNTGATPIVTTDAAPAEPAESIPVAPAPLPRPAEPVAVPAPPVDDSSVDLDAVPLTRRQARQQERIRTASVPVITPELAAAHAASIAAVAPISTVPQSDERADDDVDALRSMFAPADEHEADDVVEAESEVVVEAESEDVVEAESEDVVEAEPGDGTADDVASDLVASEVDDSGDLTDDSVEIDDQIDEVAPADVAESDVEAEPEADVEGAQAEASSREDTTAERIVNPALGAGVIAGEPVQLDLPPSFDQLLARGATGAVGTPNALILSQTTGELPMVAPVTATGDVLVTGTFTLPEGLGSTGHARGTTDGKELDAVLLDGELPAHSSPTPIAASAAVSTIKPAGEVIRPPVPEKGSRLMMWLAITAGVLFAAVAGLLIVAVLTGLL